MRRPIVVAIANYFFPGLGYILLGRKVVFGVLLMLGVAVQITQLLIDPLPYFGIIYGHSALSVALGASAIFILEVAFAYDAYQLAKEKEIVY